MSYRAVLTLRDDMELNELNEQNDIEMLRHQLLDQEKKFNAQIDGLK